MFVDGGAFDGGTELVEEGELAGGGQGFEGRGGEAVAGGVVGVEVGCNQG